MFESSAVVEWLEEVDQTWWADVGSGCEHSHQVYIEPGPEASQQGEDR